MIIKNNILVPARVAVLRESLIKYTRPAAVVVSASQQYNIPVHVELTVL
jgi:hypothetical protein